MSQFFRQFEADVNIPEHVRQLYYATLPMLKTVEQRDRLAQTLSDYADCFAKTADDIGRTSLMKQPLIQVTLNLYIRDADDLPELT